LGYYPEVVFLEHMVGYNTEWSRNKWNRTQNKSWFLKR
jgi:hypothetical protein